jgi:hypothetical protein
MEATVVRRPETAASTELSLERRADGQLWAVRGGVERAVRVRRCFPWSEPARLLSLRDDEEEEFALVNDPAALDARSRVALEAALVVTRVHQIEEEVEIRRWHVETRQGPRRFVTRLDDWPRQLPGGGLLIRDVSGDLYHLADPARLDQHSRALLWSFVD